MIPSLEDLLLVDLGCLILHEAHDEDRLARLRGRIEAEREQRNPVIVSRTRTATSSSTGPTGYALGELGSRFALVQVVEPPEKAEGWGHLLNGIGKTELDNIEGIEVSGGPGVAPLAEVETAGGETLLLSAKEDGLRGRVRALWDLQSFYPKGGVVRRVEPDGAASLSGGEALIRYTSFTPEELAEIVDSGPYFRPV